VDCFTLVQQRTSGGQLWTRQWISRSIKRQKFVDYMRIRWLPKKDYAEKLDVDLGSRSRFGRPAVLCLGRITGVFQRKIHWAKVQSCFVGVRWYTTSHLCCLCLELCINLTLRLVINEIPNKWRPVEKG
jgi:hypothetical protein